MNQKYFFELATGFWLNIAAGYFLVIPISGRIEEKVNSFFLSLICFGMAYYYREKQK